jgi:oligoribonuclease NrnB/cAMP/cGMP phosphodiesterase (DHH superfamily)
MTKQIDIVFYHKNCPDGIGGKWVVHHYCILHHLEVPVYHALAAGTDPPLSDLENKNILFVDVCPHPKFIEKYVSKVSQMIILDHHKSSMELLQNISNDYKNLKVIFKMDQCGAEIAWHYFFPNEKPPFFIDYLRDKDLWLLQLPHSHEINFALGEHLNLETLSSFLEDEEASFRSLLAEGTILKEKHDKEIEKIVERANLALFSYNDQKYKIYIVENDKRHLTSDVGNVLCEMYPTIDFAVITFTGQEYCSLSLRGIKGKCPDLCAIAKTFGGGGHPSASGMRVPNLKLFKNIANSI